MSSYIILLVGLFLIWVFAYMVNGREIGSPASIVCMMYVVTVLLCIYGYDAWNTVKLSITTILILWAGCFFFTAGCMFAFHRREKGKICFQNRNCLETERVFQVKTDLWIILVLFIAFLVIAYVRITSMKRIAAEAGMGGRGLTETAKWYRENFSRLFSAGTVRAGTGETFIEKQILRFASVIGNTITVIFFIGLSRKDKRTIWAAGAFLLVYAIYSIATEGGRAGVLYKAVIIIYGIYILQIRKKIPNFSINRLFIATAIAGIVVALPMFYYSSALVGRKAGGDMMQYLSFYYGCGVPSLEMKIRDGIQAHPAGQNVFYGVYTLLYKIGITDQLGGYANDWVDLNGYRSNVLTAWYRYYADFGFAGVGVLSLIYGWLFTWLYRKVKEGENLTAWCIFLAWGHSLFDLSRDDYLFGQYLGTAPIINLVLSILLVRIVCRPIKPEICFSRKKPEGAEETNYSVKILQRIKWLFRPEPIQFYCK